MLFFGALLIGANSCGKLNGQTQDGSDLQTVVEQGALLLDVRTTGEYEEGHVEGSINIPLGELEQRLEGEQKLEDKEQKIVVFCQSGGRSSQAIKILERNGYTSLYNGGGWVSVNQLLQKH